MAPGILQRVPAGQHIHRFTESGAGLSPCPRPLSALPTAPPACSQGPLGRKAVCGLEGGPWQAERGVEKRVLRSTSVYAPNALLLTLPNPGTECSVEESCCRWARATFSPAVPAGLLLPLSFENPAQVPNSPQLSSGCSLLGPVPGSRPLGCRASPAFSR